MKIFTDLNRVPDKHYASLLAFAGEEPPPKISAFHDYHRHGSALFPIVSPSEADYAVLPVNWEIHQRYDYGLDGFLDSSGRSDKPLIVFFWSDSDEAIPLDDAYVFRTSLYRSQRQAKTFAMPCWKHDLQKQAGFSKVQVRKKKPKPQVGFRGQAEPMILPVKEKVKKQLNRTLKWLHIPYTKAEYWCYGHQLRTQAIRNMLASSYLKTDFNVFDGFGGDGNRAPEENTRSFLSNILDNDYNLCVRGGGNYSYRLYEVISAGRIPVFINTDCVLPYDFAIDWKQYVVWVEEDEIDSLDEKILNFHESLSDQDFEDLQFEIRELWEKWISPYGFFSNFHKHFD